MHRCKNNTQDSLKQVIRWLNAISTTTVEIRWKAIVFNCLKSAFVFTKILPLNYSHLPEQNLRVSNLKKTKTAQCSRPAKFNIQQVESISLRFSCTVREPPLFKEINKESWLIGEQSALSDFANTLSSGRKDPPLAGRGGSQLLSPGVSRGRLRLKLE